MIERPLRIAQISDIHIGPTEEPVQGIDVRMNFLRILNESLHNSVDFVVFSGDIAAECAEPDAYKWVAKTIKNFPLPFVVMGGNHDDVTVMQKFIPLATSLKNGALFFKKVVKGKTLLFLDSSRNTIGKEQLDWLNEEASQTQEEVLLFIHHPPAICGCPFMDEKYSLLNIDEVHATLRGIRNIKHIFVGHYHTEKIVELDGKKIYLTPSTMQQIDALSSEFKVENKRPGWRIIDLFKDHIETKVLYIPEIP